MAFQCQQDLRAVDAPNLDFSVFAASGEGLESVAESDRVHTARMRFDYVNLQIGGSRRLSCRRLVFRRGSEFCDNLAGRPAVVFLSDRDNLLLQSLTSLALSLENRSMDPVE